uniref:G protein-coupled receptor 156 n=1 Tax=Xiphophorus couchianus TaxID=32473 RepID=A0A3B5MVS1_9TELE
MATAASILSKEHLLCPICLDVFNQPVSTPCGHNFCRDCIQRYWQSTNPPQCPMCKHKLYKRPDLKVNTFISELAAQFKDHGEMKDQIRSMNMEVQEDIHSRLEKTCEIGQAVEFSKRNTEKEVEESFLVFNKLLQVVKTVQADVAEAILAKQRCVESRASEMTLDLEQEINQLTNRNWRAESQLEETIKAEVKRLCKVEFERVKAYAVDVTLDPDTAHPKLVLSENRKQVYHSDVAVNLPDNPARFYPCVSVLGKEGFCFGRFSYEVQVKGKTERDIGVGLESVNRKGGNLLNPERGYWTLGMREDESYWALSSPPVRLPLVEKPQAVLVYVDMEVGQVSFYNSDSHSHIYTYTGYTFSERLFPYFNPRRNHSGVNSAPLLILPLNI